MRSHRNSPVRRDRLPRNRGVGNTVRDLGRKDCPNASNIGRSSATCQLPEAVNPLSGRGRQMAHPQRSMPEPHGTEGPSSGTDRLEEEDIRSSGAGLESILALWIEPVVTADTPKVGLPGLPDRSGAGRRHRSVGASSPGPRTPGHARSEWLPRRGSVPRAPRGRDGPGSSRGPSGSSGRPQPATGEAFPVRAGGSTPRSTTSGRADSGRIELPTPEFALDDRLSLKAVGPAGGKIVPGPGRILSGPISLTIIYLVGSPSKIVFSWHRERSRPRCRLTVEYHAEALDTRRSDGHPASIGELDGIA